MPLSSSGAGSTPILHRVGLAGAAARFYHRSYAADYLALGFLAMGWLLIQIFVNPFHRMFSLDNKAIQYPFAVHERVPVVMSVIYAGVIPFLIILAWSAKFHPGVQKTQVTVLGLLVALMMTSFLTDLIKNAVGRPRPDLLSRCKPSRGTADNMLVAWTVCTETNQHILQEGWRSFPSGHSSFSFSGLGYLSLFSCGQMHIFRPRADLGRCLLAFFPLLCAALIAISRLDDYRHDVWDVTCGGFLGMLVGWFSYRRYYPSLRSVNCDTPYDKVELSGVDGFSRLEDEEQAISSPFIQREGTGSDENYQLEETNSPIMN
ncbi:Phosphatidic acid phosphatase type 2/haloperoxidase [Penicillium macrosclerotiorum]|uniref:Phosphatidic acid phosphatase type 2/haloperoxidase n=1 Tax=Penicillium macrosclerotiorum TaxID=303699 RepID=UPI002549904C|nr:Phosphatidic acid phosphatase type 2/haloperoxidase [Penicillium macrosclerotiorum]KAJ5666634.1 Phosphatidic acid phosphatase type 2/haloperoxidase [Penicillium macrosclerotiorum]